MTPQYDDPFDAASDPVLPAWTTYGQAFVDVWFCGLEKGAGKVPFNPDIHNRRFTAVKIDVVAIPEQNQQYPLYREMIAESKEYKDIVWASLRTLGVTNLREVNERWCEVVTEPTGRKYTDATGEDREATTIKFLRLFDSEAECKTAYNGGGTPTAAAPAATQVPLPGATASADPEHDTAIKFLKAIVENAARGQTDPTVVMATVKANIGGMPLLVKHFGGDDNEMLAIIMEVMSPI